MQEKTKTSKKKKAVHPERFPITISYADKKGMPFVVMSTAPLVHGKFEYSIKKSPLIEKQETHQYSIRDSVFMQKFSEIDTSAANSTLLSPAAIRKAEEMKAKKEMAMAAAQNTATEKKADSKSSAKGKKK